MGCVLLFFFPGGEITAPSNQDRGYTGVDGIALIEIVRQLAGVEVHQIVDFAVVHGIDAGLLLFRDLHCFVHHGPIASGGGAGSILRKAIHILGPPCRLLVDAVITDRRLFAVDIRISDLLLRQFPGGQPVQQLPALFRCSNIERVAGG